jgi:hypothetical protein
MRLHNANPNGVTHGEAAAYAYGRYDCPERKPGNYVPSRDFTERALEEGLTVDMLPDLYNQMLAERLAARTKAGAS